MLFKKENISIKKIIASTLLFSFCNLSVSVAEPAVKVLNLKGSTSVESPTITLNESTKITNSNAKINISLRDSDVRQVLRMFANKARLNIIFHESVSGKVTLDLVDTTLNDAFEIVMDTCELTYSKNGSTLVVVSKSADTKMSFAKKNLTVIPVKYVMAQDIANFLNKNVYGSNMIGLSNKNIATVNSLNNELLIFGSQADVNAARKVVEKFDTKPISSSYSLSHTTPKEMAQLICDTYIAPLGGKSSGGDSGNDPFGGGSSNSSNNGSVSGDGSATGFATYFADGDGGDSSDGGGSGGDSSGDSSSGASITDVQLGGGVVACTIENENKGSLSNFSNYKTTVAYFPQLGTIGLYGGSQYLSNSIGEFIKDHDKKQRMAYLEMSFIQLNENGSREFSNKWGLATPFGMFNFDGESFNFGGYNVEDSGVTFDDSSVNILSDYGGFKMFQPLQDLTSTNLYYSLKVLVENGNGRVLSNPKIMATNGQKAVFDLTSDYIESADVEVSSSTSTSNPITNITYNIKKDLGLKVSVVPFISDSGYVSLNILPNYSTVKGTETGVDQKGNKYTAATLLQRKNIELKNVRVKDGETLVLAGFITEQEKQVVNKVPVLGDLPLIGFLFRSSLNDKEKTELVIMITPHIVYEGEDVKKENI